MGGLTTAGEYRRRRMRSPILAVVETEGLSVEEAERQALKLAAERARELALTLPPSSEIRGLFLRNAAAYDLASGAMSRRDLRHAN